MFIFAKDLEKTTNINKNTYMEGDNYITQSLN